MHAKIVAPTEIRLEVEIQAGPDDWRKPGILLRDFMSLASFEIFPNVSIAPEQMEDFLIRKAVAPGRQVRQDAPYHRSAMLRII